MRISTACALAAAIVVAWSGPARAEVKLTINDGHVTLTATNATIREILTEWGKVGKTTIVNAERIAGGPVTIQLTNVYEEQALDVIMRTVSAYLAAPRPALVANSSRFASIMVLPTSTPPRSAPQFNPPPPPVSDDDDDQPQRQVSPPGQRGPIFNAFPQPQFPPPNVNQNPRVGGVGGAPRPPAANQAAPQGAVGVPVPGMIVQPPQQQQQPGQVQPR